MTRQPPTMPTHGYVTLPFDHLEALRADAWRRKMSVNQLMGELVRHIIADNLVDTIMDDDVAAQRAAERVKRAEGQKQQNNRRRRYAHGK